MNSSDKPESPDPDNSNRNDVSNDSEDRILDARIEKTLSGWFSPPPLQSQLIDDLRRRLEEKQLATRRGLSNLQSAQNLFGRRSLLIAIGSLAAAVLLIVGFRWAQKSDDGLVFNRRSLAVVYSDLVASGFQPYYLCDDRVRFQETMLHRHGQSLALNDRGNRLMLGLSYPGGWTSETTAILFRVNGKPVVIFVDRVPFPNDEPSVDGVLNLRQKELHGTFMVEVSPLSESLLETISPAATEP